MAGELKKLVDSAVGCSASFGQWLKRRGVGSLPGGKLLVDTILWPGDCLKSVQYYRGSFNKVPRLLCPKTFNEKILHAKLFRRKSRYIRFADKLAARQIVEQCVGAECLAKIWWIGTDIRAAKTAALSPRFVIKANHSWSTVILVKERDTFDWDAAHETTQNWLQEDHSLRASEWQYRWIKPCLYIEEFLGDDSGKPPPDYKFFCFHGKVEFIAVDQDRFGSITRTLFDRAFNPLPFAYGYPLHKEELLPPQELAEMIRMAEMLSAKEPFLRVDLYDIGHPVFGELTLTPASGLDPFEPAEFDAVYGQLI